MPALSKASSGEYLTVIGVPGGVEKRVVVRRETICGRQQCEVPSSHDVQPASEVHFAVTFIVSLEGCGYLVSDEHKSMAGAREGLGCLFGLDE